MPGAGGGVQPGAGRPPSQLRDGLRQSYGDRVLFLNDVIDGKVIVHTQVSLAAVLPHIRCAKCEGPVVPVDIADLFLLTFPAKASASVRDRIAAVEHLAKYGLGVLKEVSVENVRERVEATLRIIGQQCTPEQAEKLYQAIEPVWK